MFHYKMFFIERECEKKLSALKKDPILIGAYTPQCDHEGNYKKRQCWASVGSCWCVDKTSGKKIAHVQIDKDGLPLCGKSLWTFGGGGGGRRVYTMLKPLL